jgi:dihydroorotase-like cyclic amidohydrolase
MVDFSKLRIEKETTHLFIPMNAVLEIRWLLDKGGVKANDCHIKPWRLVLKHQVPEIKDVSDKQRNAEIDKIYREAAKYVKDAPAVIVSHYNVDDLVAALHKTLFEDGDYDYNRYSAMRQSEIDNEEIPEEEGIYVISD